MNTARSLCTLQQGMMVKQVNEMTEEKVILVVPKPHISAYPADKRGGILTIGDFIQKVKGVQTVSDSVGAISTPGNILHKSSRQGAVASHLQS